MSARLRTAARDAHPAAWHSRGDGRGSARTVWSWPRPLMAGMKGTALAAMAATLAGRVVELSTKAGFGTAALSPAAGRRRVAARGAGGAGPAPGGGRRAGCPARTAPAGDAADGGATELMRAIEPWVVGPLQHFVAESSARLALLDDHVGPGGGATRVRRRAGPDVGGRARRRHRGLEQRDRAADGLAAVPGRGAHQGASAGHFLGLVRHAAGPLGRTGRLRQ